MNNLHTTCSKCQTETPAIGMNCNHCSRLLVKFNWKSILLFFLSFTSIGYLIGEHRLDWIGFIYAEIVFLIIIWLFLKDHKKIAKDFSIISIITFILIFITKYNFPQFVYMSYLQKGIIYFIIIFIPVSYWFYFTKTCKKHNISIFKAFSVFSFFLFLYAFIGIEINEYFKIANSRIIDFINSRLHIRMIFLAITAIFVFFVAFLNALTIRIIREKDALKIENIPVPKLSFKSNNNIINIFIQIIKPITNIIIKFYVLIVRIVLEILYTLKQIIEYIVKFILNYTQELIKLLKKYLIVLYDSIKSFSLIQLIPIIVFVIISYLLYLFISTLTGFLANNNSLVVLLILVGQLLLLSLCIFLLIIARTDYKFEEVRDSVFTSLSWLMFSVYIGGLLTSYVLWILSKIITIKSFASLGFFTTWGTTFIIGLVIFIFIKGNIDKVKETQS